jgi:alcohol dehydrogenase (cytochrome c)
MKWYYQFTPHDVHDWDSVQPPVLIDLRYQGQNRKLLLLANRNGFFYVLDRSNGHVLLARSFINKLTWASGIDQNGRPQFVAGGDETCPKSATNWNATAFSPVTRLYYVMSQEQCVAKLSPGIWKKTRSPEEPGKQYLRALDIDTGNIAWEIPEFGPPVGTEGLPGVLATAGGILFHGDPAGNFVAVDERKGKELWHFAASGLFKSSPMTYLAAGRQYVAIAAGSQVICFGLP